MLPPAPYPHKAEDIAWLMLWEQPSQATYDAWYAQAMALRLTGEIDEARYARELQWATGHLEASK